MFPHFGDVGVQLHRIDRVGRSVLFWGRIEDPGRSVEDARLLYILSEPDIIQNITAQHVVMRPRSGQIRLFVPRRLLPAA